MALLCAGLLKAEKNTAIRAPEVQKEISIKQEEADILNASFEEDLAFELDFINVKSAEDLAEIAHELKQLKNAARIAIKSLQKGQMGIIFEALTHLPKLKELEITSSYGMTPQDIAHFKKMKALRFLYMENCAINDELAAGLGELTALEGLDLKSNRVTAVGIEHLANLHKLIVLNIAYNPLNDEGIAAVVKGFSKIEALNVGSTGFTESGAEKLLGLKHLKQLHLGHTQLTQKTRDALIMGLPHTEIVFE